MKNITNSIALSLTVCLGGCYNYLLKLNESADAEGTTAITPPGSSSTSGVDNPTTTATTTATTLEASGTGTQTGGGEGTDAGTSSSGGWVTSTSSSGDETSSDSGCDNGDIDDDTETCDGGDPCGNGILDRGEKCDGLRGPGPCGDDCQLLCGNGTIDGEKGEECDGNESPGPCGDDCKLLCGNGTLDDDEQCDQGGNNGMQIGDSEVIECSSTCTTGALRAFITSGTYKGNLGGTDGGDKKCQDLASKAGLKNPENFAAWLYGPKPGNVFDKLQTCPLPYFRMDNTLLAKDAASIIESASAKDSNFLNITEYGSAIWTRRVWSCIGATDGDSCTNSDYRCESWASAEEKSFGGYGISGYGNIWIECFFQTAIWTDCDSMPCNQKAHLYCFEKCPQ